VGAASLDAVTKLAAEALLDDGPAHITGPLSFKLGHNSGVAFGLGATGPAWVVVAVTAVVIMVLAVAAWRGTFTSTFAAGLILGGAVANFIDRIGDGAVTDMIDVGWWPTFNVADIAITTGVVLLVLTQRSPRAHPGATASAADTSASDTAAVP
jgi:signal peptidase II